LLDAQRREYREARRRARERERDRREAAKRATGATTETAAITVGKAMAEEDEAFEEREKKSGKFDPPERKELLEELGLGGFDEKDERPICDVSSTAEAISLQFVYYGHFGSDCATF